MNPPLAGLAGIVLAGGASRRMGRDKATLTAPGRFGGRTLIEHVVEVVAARCAPVFVIAAPGQELPELPASILRDERPGAGPLAATGQGLRAAAGSEWAFVCAVDMPLLAAELIDELAAGTADAEVVLADDGRDHYLAALYRTTLAGRVDALVAAGERRMRALVDAAAVRRVAVADPGPLANVNTPAQWRAAQRDR